MSAQHPAPASSHRFYEIDLLRFLAAFAVLLFHYAFRGAATGGLSTMSYPWLYPVGKYGYLGVDLFFLISGFVILMTASSGSVRQFVISRVVRLYPAFWICCALSYGVSLVSARGRHVASFTEYLLNNTLLSGFANIPYIDDVYWSLLVEMKFYLLVFVVLLLGQIHRVKLLLGAWLVLYVITSAVKVKVLSFLLIPDFAPYFIAGAMFYLVARERLDLYKGVVILACYAVIAMQAVVRVHAMQARYGATYDPVVICVAIAVFFAVMYLVATGRTRAFASREFMVLGALTYPLYLLHQNIGFALFNALYPRFDVHAVMWGVTAVMVGLAYVVTRLERAIQRPMKDGLTRRLIHTAPRPQP